MLGTPTQIYKFLAPSQKEKEVWEKELKKYIGKEKDSFMQVYFITWQFYQELLEELNLKNILPKYVWVILFAAQAVSSI